MQVSNIKNTAALWTVRLTTAVLCAGVLASTLACDESDDGDTNSLALLAAAYSVANTCAAPTTFAVNKTETLATGGPSCTTQIGAGVPTWIQNNFHCMTIYTCGTSIVFRSNDLPPHKSAYYGNSSPYFETITAVGNSANAVTAHSKNPNSIISQSIVFIAPQTPTLVTSNLDSTSGVETVGLTIHGVAIFNNQAAPGDSLTTEFLTMDNFEGHPQNTGKYHYHSEPKFITNNGSQLVGIALDGYPIYGKRNQSNAIPTLDATTNTTTCTTTEFPSGTYCYHVANSTFENAFMIGTVFRGRRGTSS
jgi:YHYH protein